jgi:hypothetical protein
MKKLVNNLYTITVIFFLISVAGFSQTDVVPAASYCISDGPQTFQIFSPPNKTWACDIPGLVVNDPAQNGSCTFTPSDYVGLLPVNIVISYQNPNYTAGDPTPVPIAGAHKTFNVTISKTPTLTSASTGTMCSSEAQNYTITTDVGGNMDWSRAAVAGISEAANTGINLIDETLTNTTTSPINVIYEITPQSGCATTFYYTVTVNPAPTITSVAAGSVCSGLPHSYTTTSSIGGTTYAWSRAAVAGITEGANSGTSAIISETLTNTTLLPIDVDYVIIPTVGGCDGPTFTYTLTVNPNPVVSISGLDYNDPNPAPWYCDNSYLGVGDDLTGSPAGGVFSGSGITDLGGGTAKFYPELSGLGLIDITYTYTDGNGCTTPVTETTRVGTQVYINGLVAGLCENDSPDDYNYTPYTAGSSEIFLNGVNKTPAIIDGTATFDPTDADAVIGANTVTYQYTDVSACVNEVSQNVDIGLVPTANFSGLDAAYCENDANVTLIGNYAPEGTFSGDGITNIAGTGTATFSPSSLAPGAGYSVTYSYTTGLTCTDSETKNVTINQAPSATISGTATICEGNPTNITTTFSSVSDYTYVITDGTNNFTYTVNGVGSDVRAFSPTVNKTYSLVSLTENVNGCSGTTAGSAVITVTPAVDITTQPLDKIACPGDNISFNVVSDGVNLTYDWEFDDGSGGGFVSVGNLQSYAINGVDATYDGTYRVTVNSTTCPGPKISNEVTLSVGNSTTIITEPADVNACFGTSENLEVIATGDNLNYEWRENGVDISTIGDPNYVGFNTAVLTINNIDNTYDGNIYTCFISGDCGDETSNPATVTVDNPTVITTQPTNKTACPGSDVTYSVVATGTSLDYQWQENSGAWADIAFATSPDLLLSSVGALDAGKTYRCKITSRCGEILYSDDVALTLYIAISITTQPSNKTVCENNPVNFQVISDGSNKVYQWQFDDGTGFIPIVGATSATYTILNAAFANEGDYRCIVSNTCGSEVSDVVTLVVDEAITITDEPNNVDACLTDDISFTLTATGTNLTYQWQYYNGIGFVNLLNGAHPLAPGSLVSGVKNSSLNIDGITAGTDTDYRCQITNGCGTVNSSTVSLIIHDATTLNIAFPTDKSRCVGETANFTADVTAGTVTSYKWQFDIDGDGIFVDLNDGLQASGSAIPAGADESSSLSITNLFAADAGWYRCQVVGICGTVYSNVAKLDIDEPVNITKDPVDKMECENEDVTFTVNATGTGLSYQWWADVGGIIGTATNPNLVLTNINAGSEDDYYCVVSNSCNSQESAHANLTLYIPIAIDNDPASIARCEWGDAAFNITVDPTSDNPSYQWFQDGNSLSDGPNVNGAVLSGTTTNSLYITGITAAEAGVYTCDVTGPCNIESRAATLTVNEQVVVNTNPTSKTVCLGTNTSFIVNASGGVTSYQWQYDDLGGGGFVDLNDVGVYSGTNTTTLTITGLAASEEGVYRCKITGSCIGDVVYSNSANLTVGINTDITAQPVDVADCEGQDISFSLSATGTNLTYQWYKNPAVVQVDGGDISGTTTNTLSLANIDLTDAGVYHCVVSGTCGNVTSGNPSLTVNEGLTINTNPVSKTVCEGLNTSYVVNVSGDINGYQWQYNDGGGFANIGNGAHPTGSSTVSGANTNTINLAGIGAGDAGTYRCVIDGVCEDQNSSPAGLTVATNTTIVTLPSDADLCEGDEAIFSVNATGTSLTYEWYKASQVAPLANGVDISGATTNTLTLSNLTTAVEDVYSCVVSGFCTDETSLGANLNVSEHIIVNTQPTNKSACPGGTTSFSVTASGDIINYRWYKDGIDISTLGDPNFVNDNTPTLNIINITAAYAGDYRCEITGDCETINTNTATLTINVTTTSTNPVNVTDCEGETVSFSVTATGTTLTYEWYKNGLQVNDGVQVSGSTFSGTTSATLVIDNATPEDNGSYHCFVDGQCTDITTNTATLTINPATAVTLQPSDISVVDGGVATFTIVAEGDIDSYQWFKDGLALGVAANIAAVDQPTLTIDPVTYGADEGDYHCVVTSAACGNALSNTATLTILPTTYVSSQPANTTKCEGEDLILSITTTGGPHTYEWQFDDGTGYTALVNGAHISGSGSAVSGVITTSVVISNIQPNDQGFYRCVLNGGSDLSNSALVTVNERITIVSNPLDKQRCIGDPVTFSVSAIGAIDTYQWQYNGGDIGGANSSSYTIPAVAAVDAGNYTCIIYALGTCADETSASAALAVNSPTVLNTGPTDQLLCEGESITLPVDATGSNLTYQWYFNSGILNDGSSISGSQEKDLVISNALVTDQGNYYCEILGSCGTETTIPVVVTVDDATAITTHPISRSKCIGDQVQFSVVAEGTSLSYQWYLNGVSLGAAAQNSLLTINPITALDAGNYYCEITSANGCGDITSNAATLTIYDATAITSVLTDKTICEGTSHTLSVTATGGNLSYIWIRDNDTLTNGPNLNGVNTANLEIIDATLNESGTYWCSVTGFCGPTILTNSAVITVDPTTNVVTQPIDGEICEGDSKLFIVAADGVNLNYQWRYNGGDIGGETNSQLTIDPVALGDEGDYTCLVSSANGCGDVLTTPATLTVHESTAINVHPVGDTKCEGNSITLSVDASGGNLHYQWKKDGVTSLNDGGNLSGTKTKDLLITGLTLADDGVYTCEVSGFCSSLVSNPADLIVNPSTFVTSSPVSKTRCRGTSVTFYVTATGSNLTYQWQKGIIPLGDGATGNGSTISNSLTSAMTITDVALADAGSYRCVVNGDCGVQNSDPAILTVNDLTLITTQPSGGTYCEGDEITLNVVSSGDNLTYQWKKDGAAISDTGSFIGTQTTSLIISSATTNYEGVYSCLVNGACGNENSSTVNINVNPGTVITAQPSNKTKCEGDAVVFTISTTGSNLTYQWEKDGAPLADVGTITGSTTPVLSISNTVDTDDGAYRCVVTGDCGTVNSDAANLLVNVYPDPAAAITGPIEVCQGTSGVIYEVSAIANADYYIWSLPVGVTILSGDSTRLIEVEFDTNELGGNISVRGLNDCGYGTASPIKTVTANSIPSAQAGIDQSLCVDNTYLTAADPGTATGTWSVIDGPAIVQNINLNTSQVTNLREGTNTLIWEVEENGCSSVDAVVITNNHVTVEAGTDQTICSESITLDGSAVPTGATGSWSVITGAASFSDGTLHNAVASDFGSGPNLLKWTITKNGCTNADSLTIDNQRPTQADAGIDLSVCGDSTYLIANDPSIGIGHWSVVTGAASFEDENAHNTKVTGLSKGSNVLRWTISNGICSTSDEVTVTNNKIDVNAGVDQIICDNVTTLDATALASGTGYWSVNSGSANFVTLDDPKTVVTALSKGPNVLSWNINNNSCISSDSVVIRNDSPSDAYAGKDTTILTDQITLQGNIPSTGNGFWNLISGSGSIDDPTQFNTLVTGLGLGGNTFRWTITNNSCISTDDVVITNANTDPPDAGPDQTICSDKTTLEGNEPAFGYGEWSIIQGSATFADNSNPNTTVSGLSKGDNILKWSIWINGWSSDIVIITNDSPTDANAGIDRVLCSDSIVLAANEPLIGSGVWTIVDGAGTFENDTLNNSKVTNLAKGKNTFKWTIINRGCSDDDLVTISNDLPTIADAGIDQTLCVGEVTLSPNTPTIGTGSWSVAQGAAYFDANTAKNIAVDTNIFVWTIENNACSYSDSITIVNNEPQNANAGADKIICIDTITLAANPVTYGTGFWKQESGSADPFNTSDPTASITNLGQGLNVFKWTITYNSCVKSDRVTINNASVVATAGVDQDLCNESTYLEANNPSAGTGMWSILGGSGSANFENINEPNTLVTELDKGDNILRWTITNLTCSDYDEVIITNNLPTDAFAGPDQALCSENSILQGNTPVHGIGEWSILSGSADIADINDPSSTLSNLDYGINTLRWTITKGTCISTDEVVIANNSTINSNAGIDQTLCANSTLLFANIPAYGTGTWSVVSGSATFENNNDYNTKVINIGRGDNVLRWVISNGGCTSKDEVTITNNSPSNAIAGADQTICGNATYLQANKPSYGTGTWTLVSGAANFENNTQNNTKVTNLNPGSNTLRWTIENSGCTSDDDVVVYNDLPYEADAGEDIDVCGPEASLYANDPVSGIGQWSVISGTATFNNSSRYDAIVSGLGFGANTLRWTITYDQCTTTDEIIITNNKIQVNAGVDQIVDESSTLLAASNPSTGSGLWSVIGGFGAFESPNNAITIVSGLGSGLNTFRWSVDVNGCISYDDVSITYNIPPVASFVITDSKGCPPLDVYFVNNSLDGLPFSWDFDDGTTSDLTSFKHTYNESGVYHPSLTVIGVNGEIITKDTTITVYPQPQASFIVVDKELYIPEEEAIFINESTDAVSYEWDFGDGSKSVEKDPRHTYDTEGLYDIELHVWSDNDCYDALKVLGAIEVFESGQILFPNAFTPNLDGSSGGAYNPNDFSNDVFYPIGEGLEEYHLEIFNRWGILIFESYDINVGWDGYYDNKLLNEGVYVWKVTGKYNNGKDFKKVGTVMLLH